MQSTKVAIMSGSICVACSVLEKVEGHYDLHVYVYTCS